MEEKVNAALPQTEENLPTEDTATTPAANSEGTAFLEIKFNKEIIGLDRERAVTLAQKGMKYDTIAEEYERLKTEKTAPDDSEALLREFPELSSFEMLPEEVKTAAKNNNRGLLLEYLLYLHRQTKAAEEEAKNQSFIAEATTGSLSKSDRSDPATEEFLRGVWGK